MTYKELVRLATEPGPMQELAMQALAEEFAADDRADFGPAGHNEQFDIARFAPEYVDAKLAAPRGVPRGDEDQDESLEYQAGQDLVGMYDNLYPESMGDQVGGALSQFGDYITSLEGADDTATVLRDSFAPGYSQYDSLEWADENMDKFVNAKDYGLDPLTAASYLPAAGVGYIGAIPGAAAVVSGGRRLGKGAKALYEGLF